MSSLVIIIAAMVTPVIFIVWQKSHAATVFLSLCLGSVLVTYMSPDVIDFITAIYRSSPAVIAQITKLVLLILPALIAMFFTRKSVYSGGKTMLNLFSALASGMLLGLLLVPLLSSDFQRSLEAEPLWNHISSMQTPVLIMGSVFSLLYIMVANKSINPKKH